MIRSRSWLAIALLAATPAAAMAQTPGDTAGVRYFLLPASGYEEGCFPPCLCPVWITGKVAGGFRMVPAGFDGLYFHFEIPALAWRLQRAGSLLPVTGSGHYRIGGEFARVHQLTLDLALGDAAPERFDSGLVPGGATFPRIEIRVSRNGEFCYDQVFDIRAEPDLDLTMTAGGVFWSEAPQAWAYDLIEGDLRLLRDSGGDFTRATRACAADDWPVPPLPLPDEPGPGEGIWIAARWVGGAAVGTYDSPGTGEAGGRDAGIEASAVACP